MRDFLASTFYRFATWLLPKKVPESSFPLRNPGTSFLDAYRRHREPTAAELLSELKNTAWTCASINASVCAGFPPKLYRCSPLGDTTSTLNTRPLSQAGHQQLCHRKDILPRIKGMERIEEVIDHPLLDLLQQVNPIHNGFDLWELTQFYLEVHGSAYWYLEVDSQVPVNIWILPAQQVFPRRNPHSKNLVDFYEYHSGGDRHQLPCETVIHFRFPDPRDPYTSGLSPLRAAFEQIALSSEYSAMKRAIYDNTGIPSVVLSPNEVISDEERDRLEEQWNYKFRRGGAGKVLVSESGLKVDVLSHSMGDLAALAENKATKEDIANAFHVPLPFLSADTNLANMQASDHLHKTIAIYPRIRRRDEKLNERLVPLFDSTGQLFLMSDDPTPANQKFQLQLQESDLKYGVRTINELRSERGLPPVSWGDGPQSNE